MITPIDRIIDMCIYDTYDMYCVNIVILKLYTFEFAVKCLFMSELYYINAHSHIVNDTDIYIPRVYTYRVYKLIYLHIRVVLIIKTPIETFTFICYYA